MLKLVILQGMPRSGKTTWALDWLSKDKDNRAIVCKDDIGMELAGVGTKCEVPRNKAFRQRIHERQRELIIQNLQAGKSVCIADTNLATDAVDRALAAADASGVAYVPEMVNHFKDVPLMEILDRNAKSGCDYVPENVLFEMYNTFIRGRHFLHNRIQLPKAVVFDMDGTLAEKGNRGIYEWDKVERDHPNDKIVELAKLYQAAGYKIVIVSARQRTVECYDQTSKWLQNNGIEYVGIYMRKKDDNRRDWIVKEELLKEILMNFYIHLWVDDRFQVVSHIRSLGIDVLQVKDGRY